MLCAPLDYTSFLLKFQVVLENGRICFCLCKSKLEWGSFLLADMLNDCHLLNKYSARTHINKYNMYLYILMRHTNR